MRLSTFLVHNKMCFATQKKELINLQNSLNEVKRTSGNQWILDFSTVRLISIWENIIRNFAKKDFAKIKDDTEIKVCLDEKRFFEYVWKSWRDGKQKSIGNNKIQLEVKKVRRYSTIRNKVAHGKILTETEKEAILNIDNELLKPTLEILKEL